MRRTRHTWLAIVMAAVLAIAAACGGGDDPAASADTQTAPTTEAVDTQPAPAPEDTLREEAGRRYLELIEPSNERRRSAELSMREAAGDDDLAGMAAGAREFANDAEALADELTRLDVPPDAQGALDQFVRSQSRIMSSMRGVARAADRGDPFAASRQAEAAGAAIGEAHTNAGILRARLGLPPPG